MHTTIQALCGVDTGTQQLRIAALDDEAKCSKFEVVSGVAEGDDLFVTTYMNWKVGAALDHIQTNTRNLRNVHHHIL